MGITTSWGSQRARERSPTGTSEHATVHAQSMTRKEHEEMELKRVKLMYAWKQDQCPRSHTDRLSR